MPRKKEPEGKRVTLSFKVSEPEAAAIEAARGGVDRSEWLRRAALASEDVTWRHERKDQCHHLACHSLTCEEYDALRLRAAGRCEICGTSEEETTRGLLVIDHYEDASTWYIRGLLCDRCNVGVMACYDGKKPWGENRQWEQKAAEYAARSWQSPSDKPRGRKRMITYRIDADLYDAAAAKAARMGETVTDVITRAFREYVEGEPPQTVHGIKIVTDERMPPGTAALVSRDRDGVQVSAFSIGATEPGPQQDAGQCLHRLSPGAWCKTCRRTKT